MSSANHARFEFCTLMLFVIFAGGCILIFKTGLYLKRTSKAPVSINWLGQTMAAVNMTYTAAH